MTKLRDRHWRAAHADALRRVLVALPRPLRVVCYGIQTLEVVPLDALDQGGEVLTVACRSPALARALFSQRIARGASLAHELRPTFAIADLTGGRASAFETRCEELVAQSIGVEEAIAGALEHIRACRGELDVSRQVDSDADLIISVDQFGTFGRPAHSFGVYLRERYPEIDDEQLSELADRLFWMQIEGHVQVMHRSVRRPGGLAYVAASMLSHQDGTVFTPALESLRFAELLQGYFDIDVNLLAPETLTLSTGDIEVRALMLALAAPRARGGMVP